MYFEATHNVLAVVVVELVGAVAVEHADAVVDDAEFVSVLRFDREEAEMAVNAGAKQVWLGKRILRCETAPITALSILMFLTNNM